VIRYKITDTKRRTHKNNNHALQNWLAFEYKTTSLFKIKTSVYVWKAVGNNVSFEVRNINIQYTSIPRTAYVWNTKVQYDKKFPESRKSQHSITIKCPHIISNRKIGTCSRSHTK
jgi:hypothetical protein